MGFERFHRLPWMVLSRIVGCWIKLGSPPDERLPSGQYSILPALSDLVSESLEESGLSLYQFFAELILGLVLRPGFLARLPPLPNIVL